MSTLTLALTIMLLFGQPVMAHSSPMVPAADSVTWIQVPVPGGLLHAAIATPAGTGPFPAVVILHGTHGFAQQYVQLARRLAEKGMVGIAACWFAGRRGEGVRFITPIDYPGAPAFVAASEGDRFRLSRQTIDSLIHKVRLLNQVQVKPVVLFGHSLGGGAALDYLLTHPGQVQGAILNSTGYPSDVIKRVAAQVQVPLLLLHGTADGPTDGSGGSALTDITVARQFEAALRASHKPIEVNYYQGSGHNSIFIDSTQFEDTARRIASFVATQIDK